MVTDRKNVKEEEALGSYWSSYLEIPPRLCLSVLNPVAHDSGLGQCMWAV